MRNQLASLIAGTIIFLATVAAWLYGELNHINTSALLTMSVPVIGALFMVGGINAARDAAQQAASQTNGAMDTRIKAQVAAALGDRDAARTRQAIGDVSSNASNDEIVTRPLP